MIDFLLRKQVRHSCRDTFLIAPSPSFLCKARAPTSTYPLPPFDHLRINGLYTMAQPIMAAIDREMWYVMAALEVD